MKKALLYFVFIYNFYAFGQSPAWNALLVIEPYPTSFYSVWQNNQSSSFVTINYTATAAVDFKVRIILRNSTGKELARITSPIESFTAGPSSKTYFATDFLGWSDNKYDNATLQKIIRTNRFPEGFYEMEAIILSSTGSTLAQTSGSFTIIYPDAPVLLDPQNGSTEDRQSPIFTWAPVNLPPTINFSYNLKIVKRFPGQSITQAINVNPVHHEADVVNNNSYIYPLSELQFENGQEYVWRVRVIDENGNPLTSNDGNSEFWTFNYFSPGSSGAQLPFSSIELERNVAWFTDFSQLTITTDEQNFIASGTTTLITRLSDGEIREFNAIVQGLTFQKNKYNPFRFVSGRVVANIPQGGIPTELLTPHFTPLSIEYDREEKLFLRGEASIPGGRSPLKIPGIVPIKPGGILEATIKYRSGGGNSGGGSGSIDIQKYGSLLKSTEQYASLGSGKISPLSVPAEAATGSSSSVIQKKKLEDPIYSFGNSAIRINITGYELVYPEAIARFSGEVRAFNNFVVATISNLTFNESGELTGTIDTNTPLDINFVSNESGKYVLKTQGVSGTFHFEPTSEESAIDISLKNAKFSARAGGIFSQPFIGSAAMVVNLKHSSSSLLDNGMIVSSLSDFVVEGTAAAENPIRFGNSLRLDVNSLNLDSVTYSSAGLDFKFRLGLTFRFPGLALNAGTIEDIVYTKRGIALPGLYSAELMSDSGSGLVRNISGYQLEFTTATTSSITWNGGTTGISPQLSANLRFSNFPVGSSEDLFTLVQSVTAALNSTGMSISLPAKTFTASFIAIPGDMKYYLKELKGTITGVLANNIYQFSPTMKVKGDLQVPAGVLGTTSSQDFNASETELNMSGFGIINGTIRARPNASMYEGTFALTIPEYDIRFSESEGNQAVEASGAGKISLSPLTGSSERADFNFRYNLVTKSWSSLTGTYSTAFTIGLPQTDPAFRLSANSLSVTPEGIKINGRHSVRIGDATTAATVNNLLYRYSTATIASGNIVFDLGFGISVNSSTGGSSPALFFSGKSAAFPAQNGAVINTPGAAIYNNEGLVIASGSDSAYLTYNGLNYKTVAVFEAFKAGGAPFTVRSGRVNLILGSTIVASLTSQGLVVDETALPALPEKIALLNHSVGYLQVKNGITELVDWSVEGENVRIRTRTEQPVNAVFPALRLNSGLAPDVPVTFNILVNKTNYDIVDGSIQAIIPGDKLASFDLTSKRMPLKLRSLSFAKNSSGIYELLFGAGIAPFGEALNTDDVSIKINGAGLLTGNLNFTANKNIPLRSGTEADRLILQANTVTGSFNTDLLAYTNPEYQIDITGGIKLRTMNNSYAGANAKFKVTGSGIEVMDYTADNFTSPVKFDLGKMNLELKAFRLPEISYSQTTGWSYTINLDAILNFTVPGLDFSVPQLNNIKITQSGITFPVTQMNNVVNISRTFLVDGFPLRVRNFRTEEFTISSLDPASFNINNTPFRFDFTGLLTGFPANYPATLRNTKLYIQNAGFVNGFLSGGADSTVFNPVQNIPFANSGRIAVMELDADFAVKNNTQALNVQVESYAGLPANLRAPGWIVFGAATDNRQSISSSGIISGTFTTINLVTVRHGNTDLIVSPGATVILGDSSGVQTMAIESNNMQAVVNFQTANKATGTGYLRFDIKNAIITAGNIELRPAFKAILPYYNFVFNFEFSQANINQSGIIINGSHTLLAGTERISTSFSNFTLDIFNLYPKSGSFNVTQPFSFYLSLFNNWLWWQAVNSGFVPAANPSMVFRVPNLTVSNNKYSFTGESTGAIRFNNELVNDFRVVFENSPEIEYSTSRVIQGSIAFYKGTTKAAFVDVNGMNLTNMGAVMLPENLVLGDMNTAYVRLRQGETKYVTTENVSNGVRIRNIANQTVQLVVPGLKYTAATAPTYNITLDVVVNPTTYTVISGTINHQAAAGQSLADLSAFGIPLKVTRVKYISGDAGYSFKADGLIALPQVLRSLETELTNISFANGKLSGFANSGNVTDNFNPTAPYLKMLRVGTMAEFKLQGIEYDFGQNPAYKISGDIKSRFFKYGTSDTSNIHFTANFSGGQFRFTVTSGATDGLGINKFRLFPAAIQNNPAMAIAFTNDNFSLSFNGSLRAPEISPGFETTIRNLVISKDAVTTDNVSITTAAQEQVFTIFAGQVRLRNVSTTPAVTFSYTSDVYTLNLAGAMTVLGQSVQIQNLRLTSAGVISFGSGSPVTPTAPLSIIQSRLSVNNLSIVTANNKYSLRVGGSVQLPAPAVQTAQAFTFDIPSDQLTSQTVDYPILNEAPGLGGGDQTEPNFWAGKFDLQYMRLNVNYSNISASKLSTVSTFYVDGVATERFIKLGTVSGGSVTPGMSINFRGRYEWANSLTLSNEVKFTYNNLKYSLSNSDIEFEPDTSTGAFVIKVSGSVELAVTGFSGKLNFSGLEVHSNNQVRKFNESLTGGSVTIDPLITVQITRLAMSTSPTNIYIPDPNGNKYTSGPDKGKVITIAVPVQFYLVFGGSVKLGDFAEGGVDSFLVFRKTDGAINFVVQNLNFKKKDKFEFKISIQMLSGTGSDFVLAMGGMCDVSGNSFAAYGKVARWQGKFSAGLFIAALEGMKISFFGLADITGVGGGFFFNPTEADINMVRDLCGFNDESTAAIKAKVKGTPATGTPSFSIFIYGAVEFGSASGQKPLTGRVLLTIANDRLILDGKVVVLKRDNEITGLLNVEVSFTQRYIEGTLSVTLNMDNVLNANATMQMFYYSTQNWGIIGTATYKVMLNLLSGDGDFYAGSKGFYAAANFNQGFDVWVVSVNSGISLKAWYKPDVSWGAYFRLYLEASVLGGVASARGEVKGVLIGAPQFALAGGASLRVRLLFISWNGDVWLRIQRAGIKAGFGKDDAVQRLIAEAESISNDFLAAVNAAKADLENNKPLPTLGITPQVIAAASAELVKRMLKARSLTADGQITQAEKDSIAAYLTSELAGGDNATIRNYITRLRDNILAAGTEAARTEINTLMNELNTAINNYKSSIAQVTQAVSNLAMTTEVPSAAGPEGVMDPVEVTRFTWPTSRNETPQSTDPSFELNAVTAANNNSVVNAFMSSAEGYHDMLKRNIEKIEGTIAKFDNIFRNPNNTYLGITYKYVNVVAKTQGYIKKLAQYYYNDITSANTFRTAMVSDSNAFYQQIRAKDLSDGAGRMKVKVYQRWARIRGLAASSQTPWDHSEFETVWGRFSNTQRELEGKVMAQNLYMVIPDQAFFNLMGNRKTELSRLHDEFVAKIKNVEEHQATYTRMLDELFAKRRKMSENLFEVVERFIYWKDKPQRGANDRTIDFKNIAPTLATLQTKRTNLIASNTAPNITVNSATQTNYKSHTEMSLGWSATHANGIVEYSLESNYLPGGFKSVGLYTVWYPYLFANRTGEYDGFVTYRVRARSASGFTKTAVIYSGTVRMGFADANIGAPAQTVTAAAPVDNTWPVVTNPTIDEIHKLAINSMTYPGQSQVSSTFNGYYTNKTTDFRMRITANDPESGISYFRYKIEKYNGPGNFVTVRDWQNIGAINEYLIQGLNLAHCATQLDIRRSNNNNMNWYAMYTVPRYVITVEATNGAGLTNTRYVCIVVDTTTPPALTASTPRPPTTIRAITGYHQGSVANYKYDTTSIRSIRPQREARKIVFPTSLTNQTDIEYYYNVYAMPDGIRINSDYLVDNETYTEAWGSGSANVGTGKIATIPAQYDQYDQFKIELMYKTKSGAFSPVFTTTDWYYPYRKNPPQYTWNTGRGWATIDAFPTPPQVYWFNDRNPGQPNNLKLYFRNFGESLDGTGMNRFYYSVGTVHTLTNHISVNYLTWKELPPVSDEGIVAMDASFFSTWSSQSWFTPGNQIYVYIKGVNNSFWAGRNVTVVGPITLAPPTVASVSLDIIRDATLTPNRFVAELTIGSENEATTKTYLVRTQVFRNGNWVAPTAPLTGAWTEVRNIIGVTNWHLTTKYKLNTLNMMPVRNLNSAGTGFQNMNERWRVQVKSRDNGGNESEIVSKEIIW